jgi:hypothetical protein
MAMTEYSGNTAIIAALGTTPAERGLTDDQFKAKFDEALAAFVAWFNDTHKAEFEVLIEAIGSNTDGSYVKFSNGLMVCWNSNISLGNININSADGNVFCSPVCSWTYPIEFTATPAVTTSIRACIGANLWVGKLGTSFDNATTASAFVIFSGASKTNIGVTVKSIAIGKWK